MGTRSPVVLSEVTVDSIGEIRWSMLNKEQRELVRNFRISPNAKSEKSVAERALIVALQDGEIVRRVAMYNAGLFVHEQITAGQVGPGKTFPNQAALAAAIRRSPSYISRLKIIGKAAALGIPDDEMSFVLNNPGGKTSDAIKDATTKTAATEAVKALAKAHAASGGSRGTGGSKTSRKQRHTDEAEVEAKANADASGSMRTSTDVLAAWRLLVSIVSELSDTEAAKVWKRVRADAAADIKRREALSDDDR